jgi:DNA-binding GntR family transcriptional regulator
MTTLAPPATPALGSAAAPSFARAQSLAAQIADFIVDGIAGGTYAFGQRLIETELAARLKVSRVPIREALKMLEAQGILVVTPHRGAYIAEFDKVKSDRVRDARIALERLAIPDALATFQKHPEKLTVMEELLARMDQAIERQDWIDAGKADLQFHRQICLASNNEIVITLWEALARHITIIFGRELSYEDGNPKLREQHTRVLHLIRKGDLDGLHQELHRHVMRYRTPVNGSTPAGRREA